MSRLLCCLRARQADMGAALSHPQEGEASDGAGVPAAPPTMADVIRERKKKALGSGLGTLRRRIALVRRPRENRPDRGCEHARFIRSVVANWRLSEVFLLCQELEAAAALRDLATQAELAREPAAALHADLLRAYTDRWWCDVELSGAGWAVRAHRALLGARCAYFRELLARHPAPPAAPARPVPLDGVGAQLSRQELEAALLALYGGASALCDTCAKWDRGDSSDGDLDVINVENGSLCRSRCVCGSDGASLRRLGSLLGFSISSLHHDMRYLLDSGELSDAVLVFRLDSGASYGFRAALELPCHRLVLAARSRFFRSVMSRRGAGGPGGAGPGGPASVCVDESVLPRRFARALLHAAYTDTVDLTLIGRGSTSPSSSSSNGSSSGWSSAARLRPVTSAVDDACQLYEIARFLEMPIVVQGCEDAIVEALSPETLPQVLRWGTQPHASQWVHRQAMRYLRDEFPTIMSNAGCGRIPQAALSEVLASTFLQASELQALRAVLKWGQEQRVESSDPNVAWTRAAVAGRRGARRREAGDGAVRDALAPLAPLLRLEHVPPDHDLVPQLVRRGILPHAWGGGGGTADAWLARGANRPPRCFIPYLDEIKALLEDQAVPEAELARARRERYLHRIPDTLYMVAAARVVSGRAPESAEAAGAVSAARACVSARALCALRARARRLRATVPAARALALHDADKTTVYKQIALRAVREMSLPDACADLLLPDLESDREQETDGWESNEERERQAELQDEIEDPQHCCRSGSAGSRLARPQPAVPASADTSRAGTCRREPGSRTADSTPVRAAGSLSAAVPDVAMAPLAPRAPNANTHLLTPRDYFRPAPPWEYSGGVLQLDLGDGATHTPRPGSRAQRAAAPPPRAPREQAQAMSCLRSRADEDELRAAIELSVMRAYSSFGCRSGGAGGAGVAGAGGVGAGGARRSAQSATLPHPQQRDMHAPTHQPTASRCVSGSPPCERRAPRPDHTPPHLHLPRAPRSSRSPSPAPPPDRFVVHRHDYRVESRYGSSSRGHSPNTYA